MITLLEEYETQRKLLKVRFYPCHIPTNRVNKNRWRYQYGSKDACTIDKSS